LVAASSVAKLPRVLVVLRITLFKLSIALVVYTPATPKPESSGAR
jgi:hypothetical protein